MPNTFGGRNFKKAGKKRKTKNPNIAVPTESGIDFHGQVVKRIGGNQIQVKVFSLNDDIIATIPGRFMRKVWFNAGDYVHVQQHGKFYDVIQKLQMDDEISNAKRIQNKNAITGEEDIFRQDEEEEEDDFDEIPESGSESESEEDEFGNKNSVNKISTKNITKSEKINNVKINKNNVSVDKLRRKLQEKERELSRRGNTDFAEKPTSIIEKNDETESDEPNESNESKSDDPKSDDINIDDI
jgi:translation initiation factor IF-1